MAKLDKDLKRLHRLETGAQSLARRTVPLGLGVLFLALIAAAAAQMTGLDSGWAIFVAACVVGGYMALNIGANDVANNMAPAVGSRVLTITAAVAIAAVFEAAGAIIAGGDVVNTVASGIIDPARMPDTAGFVTAMLAALFAAALWINLATWVNAPVSTTHSIVGAVLGAGLMTAGLDAANWPVVGRIVASWVVSPAMGGLIAAGVLAYINAAILDRKDKLAAARRQTPVLIGVMAGAFTAYLVMKGLSRIWPTPLEIALLIGLAAGVGVWLLARPFVVRGLTSMENRKHSVGELFTLPVICGACLLSFAHGSNDVANAVGPLAAIYMAISEGALGGPAPLPHWILAIGAIGIAVGLTLYGPRLIRTVGSKITKLNRVRAFCVTLSASITVIFASALGLPVSSTHVAIGALFGVGFFREMIANNGKGRDKAARNPEKQRKRYLVRRSHLFTIVAAWLTTVPASATIAAALVWTITATGLVTLD